MRKEKNEEKDCDKQQQKSKSSEMELVQQSSGGVNTSQEQVFNNCSHIPCTTHSTALSDVDLRVYEESKSGGFKEPRKKSQMETPRFSQCGSQVLYSDIISQTSTDFNAQEEMYHSSGKLVTLNNCNEGEITAPSQDSIDFSSSESILGYESKSGKTPNINDPAQLEVYSQSYLSLSPQKSLVDLNEDIDIVPLTEDLQEGGQSENDSTDKKKRKRTTSPSNSNSVQLPTTSGEVKRKKQKTKTDSSIDDENSINPVNESIRSSRFDEDEFNLSFDEEDGMSQEPLKEQSDEHQHFCRSPSPEHVNRRYNLRNTPTRKFHTKHTNITHDDEQDVQQDETPLSKQAKRRRGLDNLSKIVHNISMKKNIGNQKNVTRTKLKTTSGDQYESSSDEGYKKYIKKEKKRPKVSYSSFRKNKITQFIWGPQETETNEEGSQSSLDGFIVSDDHTPTQVSQESVDDKTPERDSMESIQDFDDSKSEDEETPLEKLITFDEEDGMSQETEEESHKEKITSDHKDKVPSDHCAHGSDNKLRRTPTRRNTNELPVPEQHIVPISNMVSNVMASMKRKEAFMLYLQWIASCLINPEFETYIQNEEKDPTIADFRIAVRTVEHHLIDRKNMLITSSAWKEDYKELLDSYPYLKCSPVDTRVTCEACNRYKHYASGKIVLRGDEYNDSELFGGTPFCCTVRYVKAHPKKKTLYCGSVCFKRSIFYHTFHHYKFRLIEAVQSKLAELIGTIDSQDEGDESEEKEKIESFLAQETYMNSLYEGFSWLMTEAETLLDSRREAHSKSSHLQDMDKILFSGHGISVLNMKHSRSPKSSPKRIKPPKQINPPPTLITHNSTSISSDEDDDNTEFKLKKKATKPKRNVLPPPRRKRSLRKSNSLIGTLILKPAEIPESLSAESSDNEFKDFCSSSYLEAKKSNVEKRKQELLFALERENAQEIAPNNKLEEKTNNGDSHEIDDSILSVDLYEVSEKIKNVSNS